MDNQTMINENPAVFKFSLRELTEAFIPQKIFHRDMQIQEISLLFEAFKNSQLELYNNLIIQGFSGTGKTTIVSHILKKNPKLHLFVSGADCQTAFSIFKGLFNISGSTLEYVIGKAKQMLKHKPKILVIDEINKLRNLNEIKIFFDMLNNIYRDTQCPIILITNKRGLMGLVPDDARLTFHFERVDFKPYNAHEIYDIMFDRVNTIGSRHHEIKIEEGHLRYIAAHVINYFDGSVRSALNLTRKCIIADNFSDKFIEASCQKIIKEEWINDIHMLSKHHREFLFNLVELSKGRENGEVKFKEIAAQLNYSPGRISQILSFLENFGIIKSRNVNQGRKGGNSRIISFTTEEHKRMIEEALF